MLDRAVQHPITIVNAPSGYGKTELVSSWTRRQGGAVAWLTTDGSDKSFVRFIADLVRAIHRVDSGIGRDIGSSAPGVPPSPELLAAWISDDIAQTDRVLTLVLDDAQAIVDDEVFRFLTALLRYPLPNLRTILITQTALPVDLEPLRRRGQVAELGIGDLAFSADESRDYLTARIPGLPAADIEAIVELAEGWVSALKIMALSSENYASWLQHASRQITTIVDHLTNSLLNRWDPAFRRLMVAIAIPERISPGLLDAMGLNLDGRTAPDMLRLVSQGGYFLQASDEVEEIYRFHSLFRASLLAQCQSTFGVGDLADIHRRFASWYSGQDDIDEAIAHFLAADAASAAADLVVSQCQEALVRDRWLEVGRWLQLLPYHEVECRVELVLAKAWVAESRGQHDILIATLQSVRDMLVNLDPEDEAARTIAAELALLTTYVDQPPLRELLGVYHRVYERLAGTNRFAEMIAIQYYLPMLVQVDAKRAHALADSIIASSIGKPDRISQARALWTRVALVLMLGASATAQASLDLSRIILTHAQRLDARRLVAFGHIAVGTYALALGYLDEAATHFREGAENPSAPPRVRVGSGSRLARTLDSQGRYAEADAVLQRTLDRLLEADATDFIRIVRTAEIMIAVRRGNFARAGELARSLDIDQSADFVTQPENPMLARAIGLVMSGRARDANNADELIAWLYRHPANVHWLESRVHVIAIRALRAYQTNHRDDAASMLDDAVALAEQSGSVRMFADLGPEVEALLAWHLGQRQDWDFLREQVSHLQVQRRAILRALGSIAPARSGIKIATTLLPRFRSPLPNENMTSCSACSAG